MVWKKNKKKTNSISFIPRPSVGLSFHPVLCQCEVQAAPGGWSQRPAALPPTSSRERPVLGRKIAQLRHRNNKSLPFTGEYPTPELIFPSWLFPLKTRASFEWVPYPITARSEVVCSMTRGETGWGHYEREVSLEHRTAVERFIQNIPKCVSGNDIMFGPWDVVVSISYLLHQARHRYPTPVPDQGRQLLLGWTCFTEQWREYWARSNGRARWCADRRDMPGPGTRLCPTQGHLALSTEGKYWKTSRMQVR